MSSSLPPTSESIPASDQLREALADLDAWVLNVAVSSKEARMMMASIRGRIEQVSGAQLGEIERLRKDGQTGDNERCEGCGAPATTSDADGIGLCQECLDGIPPMSKSQLREEWNLSLDAVADLQAEIASLRVERDRLRGPEDWAYADYIAYLENELASLRSSTADKGK